MAGFSIKKDNISNVYLFYGEEAFKRRMYKEQLISAVPYNVDMNYSYFEGKNIDFGKVYDSVVTIPFFAEKRLVIVENSGKFALKKKKKDEPVQEDDDSSADELILKIIEELPETTCLAFFEESAAKTRKIFKAIVKAGAVCECAKDAKAAVMNWLARGFAKNGKKIRQSTCEMLVDRVGTDYDRLRMEFEKIVSYVGEGDVINDEDVLAVTSEDIESKVFDMLAAMSTKNPRLALNKYYDLLANKEQPLIILALIRTQFRTMLQVAELSNQGMRTPEVAKAIGKKDFVVEKAKKQLANFKRKTIEQILDEISGIDKDIKTGNLEPGTAIELLLVKYSR